MGVKVCFCKHLLQTPNISASKFIRYKTIANNYGYDANHNIIRRVINNVLTNIYSIPIILLGEKKMQKTLESVKC